jgi:hypothetical protein
MATFTRDIGEGIKITLETGAISSDRTRHLRLAITVVYDYMESDPILVLSDVAGPGAAIRSEIDFFINPDLVDKRITAFNVWVSNNPEEITEISDWFNDYSTYFLAATLSTTNGDWAGSFPAPFTQGASLEVDGISDITQLNLLDALGHQPDLERSRVKPRYISRAQRRQGSVVVIDNGNRQLNLSSYSGLEVHEDENFVNNRTDIQGNPMIFPLEGRGDLLGVEVFEGTIYSFRETEVEPVDLYSGVIGLNQADFIAPKSLLVTPYGMFWAGRSGLYMLPLGGGGMRPINDSWKNLYDGSVRDELGNSTITHEMRKNCVVGYDPFNISVWFQLDQTYRYHLVSEGIWSVRDAELADFFITTEDGKLVIGTDEGLFEYPQLSGDTRYLFEVSNDTLSHAGGVPFKMVLNLGSFYSITVRPVLFEVIIDYRGESLSGNGYFIMKFYANDSDTPFDTKKFYVDGKSSPRGVAARGQIEQLRIEIEIPDDVVEEVNNLEDVLNLDISRISLGYTSFARTGNN